MGSPTIALKRYALVATAAALLGTVAAAPSVSAADRSVDPASLTPPPPDFFDASCSRSGRQIICDLAFVDPVSPVEEPSGILCGSGASEFEVLDTWSRTVVGKRFYSSDGLLLRRHFNDDWNGTLTNSATGATVSYQQHNTYLHDLGTPGDSATGFERQTTHLRATADDGNTVLIDAGRVVLSHDDDSVVFQAGPHPINDYFEGDAAALSALCDALLE